MTFSVASTLLGTAQVRTRTPDGRRRASHSMEAVLAEAVALLDESGESALTFRALAARLGGGVASIYWYVASKDELLDRATDHAIGGVLAAVEHQSGEVDRDGGDPVDVLRTMAVTLFDAIVARPWLTAYFMRNTILQTNSLRLYEQFGRQTLRLDLTARQRFHAVSAILGVVIGTADLGQEPPAEVLDGRVDRAQYLDRVAQSWRDVDAADFPFLHEMLEELAVHDDLDQFRAALDLTLAGLRQQTAAGAAEA